MSAFMIITVLMVVFHKETMSTNCGENYKIPSEWNCKDLLYHLSAKHIEDTFYCVGYNRYEPTFNSIEFQRQVIDLLKVDEQEHQITIYEKLTIKFNDSLLAFSSCPKIKLQFFKDQTYNFWHPDFDTSMDTLLKPQFDKITINALGEVKMRNLNKQIRLKCRMNYIWYPFDTQRCHHYIIIDEKKLTIQYNATKTLEESRIQNSVHPDWTIHMEQGKCPLLVTESCFSLDLVMKRKIANHIFQAYMPSIFLIISSVTSLFIPNEHMPARMSLSVTTALAMITLLSNNSWPKTAYLKAIDIWAILSYITVFYCLLEYCIVLALFGNVSIHFYGLFQQFILNLSSRMNHCFHSTLQKSWKNSPDLQYRFQQFCTFHCTSS